MQIFELSKHDLIDKNEYIDDTKGYVFHGKDHCVFDYIINMYNESPTNESILNVYSSLLFGKGITVNGQDSLYDQLNDVFLKKDQRQTLKDLKVFGMASVKLVRTSGGGIGKIKHFPVNKLAMGVSNDKGVIEKVYYSYDWTDTQKYKPKPIPVFNGKMSEKEMILLFKPYQSGQFYYSLPDYYAGLKYAEIEKEIADFSVNHIKNGLSFGYIINVNNGSALTDEQKSKIEQKIKDKLTGSQNAGKFIISFNDGKDAEVTIVPLNSNSDNHLQWESLREDAAKQLIVAHGVTSPLLFGMPSAGGFGSNADELNTASKLLQDYQITPVQEYFIDTLKPVLELMGLETDLKILPLRDSYTDEEKEEVVVVEDESAQEEDVNLSDHDIPVDLQSLFDKSEDFLQDDYEVIDISFCDEITLTESQLNTIFNFASVVKSDSRKKSIQDTTLFKIRYKYAGNPNPQRDFCKKMIRSNKVFRSEDLENAGVVNAGFGANGSNTYNIFLYKGGPNCKHFFERVVYLKKNNKSIGVNEARRLILQLEPEERKAAMWEKNPKEVAQMPYDMPNNGYLPK